ncbi:MAG: head-tail connector protein [Brevundimonas sp.]|uniref:head-tail connector protein n=1 Tax=Brevundimonas sp. TaxID=1871086 RepID=UPI0040342EB2
MEPLAERDDVKRHLRVETADHDDLIDAYIAAVSGDIGAFYTWEGDPPPMVAVAVMLKVGALFDPAVRAADDDAADRLLWSLRRWTSEPDSPEVS